MSDTMEPIGRQIAAADAEATLSRIADRWVLTMTRRLGHPVERVWPMLVDPARLARWSPLVPDRALDTPGPATSRETPSAPVVDAEVLAVDPPRELVHRWGLHVLRWTLHVDGDGTRLMLEHTFDERGDRGSFAAGWHLCLAVLGALLDGYDVERVVGLRACDYGWPDLKNRYETALS